MIGSWQLSADRRARIDGFPSDFTWGCSSSSYQIEGSTRTDGRGVSIWDTFARTPGKVYGGMTGDLACDSYRRWRDDVELIKGLGVDSYRYSVAWPRIQPEGSGRALQAGMDYYKALADALAEAGIESAVTLYHWDLPQALEDKGGWPSRETALRFADFADLVYHGLGDRVGRWFTLNEPWCSAFLGYGNGHHAPGRSSKAEAYAAAYHLLLAHGLAVKAYRETGLGSPYRHSAEYDDPAPGDPKSRGRGGRRKSLRDRNYAVAGSHIRPRLPAASPRGSGRDDAHPSGRSRGYRLADRPAGRQLYSRSRCADSARPEGFSEAPGWEDRTEMGWAIAPEGLCRMLRTIASRWPVKEIFITENGAAFPDHADADGHIRDRERIAYLRSHFAACRRAISEGIPLKGYFVWSLLDNFEWAFGYSKKFGLVQVDPTSGFRKPKDSYYYYRDVVAGMEF